MMIFFRSSFIFISSFILFLFFYQESLAKGVISGIVAGGVAFLFLVIVEYVSHALSKRTIFSAIFGLIFGLILAFFLNSALLTLKVPVITKYFYVIQPLLFYLAGFGIMMFFVINNEEIAFFDNVFPKELNTNCDGIAYKILDTSVIIDGRIADICDTGFLEGILIIPSFVLHELQMIADSADSLRRNRGRRGLDILNKMQKDQSVRVKISDVDFPDVPEVDMKLVHLGKKMNAMLVTNDFNLNKVAQFHGVKVLNINQLSNSLKQIVLPGEEMKIDLVKEGKDSKQAIGYLDDGTMVVVENGRKKMNETTIVVVTSVLQTTAGRMIFTRLK